MIKFAINCVNFFRTKNKLQKLQLKFYSDGPIKLEKIKNLDLKKRIAKKILEFYKNCDFLYNNFEINENLKISGLWKNYLLINKKDQFETYASGDLEKIILLHENMFYNSLIKGLWSYSHYNEIKKDYTALILFLRDVELYKIIFRNFSGLPTSDRINKWGYREGKNKFHFLDISSNSQKNLIINSLNLIKNKKKFNILEIGGGFGSLAERLHDNEKIQSITIFDVPSSLAIAYYYLCSKFGEDKVDLINSKNEIHSKLNLNLNKIYLIPSAFFDEIKKYNDFDLMCNFASFSEMGFKTVKYYLENLPESVKLIVSSNSNNPTARKDTSHIEVIIDNFPIPKNFDLLFSTIQTPFFSNWRYKTKVWFKNLATND